MIELHTKITCECGHDFYAMYMDTTGALPSELHQTVQCPFCGKSVEYAYEFGAEFPCFPKKWQFWKLRVHYIANHCAFNEGTMQAELYPRNCVCGKEILLKQKRVM